MSGWPKPSRGSGPAPPRLAYSVTRGTDPARSNAAKPPNRPRT